MKKNLLTLCALTFAAILVSSCSSDKMLERRIEKTLEEKPELVLKVIEKNPEKFFQTFQLAMQENQKKLAKLQQEKEEAAIAEAIASPLQAEISKEQIIRGPKDAPITIVEYSDFECPYCAKSKDTIKELQQKYPGKIRIVYKHLPLSFHANAMISAKYYEAISLQSPQKAFEFHDQIFSNQVGLKKGEPFLTRIAENLGVNMVKLQKDLYSPKVMSKIKNDIAEANKFEFQGTPGFLINGVPVKGAYPAEHFENIISKLKAKGKITL